MSSCLGFALPFDLQGDTAVRMDVPSVVVSRRNSVRIFNNSNFNGSLDPVSRTKMKNPKFNHALSVSFVVEGSDHDNWADSLKSEKEKVINALIEKINVVLSDDDQYAQAIEGFDTFEEQ